MKGKELPCTQNTFAPKRVQCRILSKHKHFSSIGILGEGEYIEMEKQERQAVYNGRAPITSNQVIGKAERLPSAPESFICRFHRRYPDQTAVMYQCKDCRWIEE